MTKLSQSRLWAMVRRTNWCVSCVLYLRGLQTARSKRKALEWSATVNSARAAFNALPPVCTFDWQRDYALYWNGPDGSFEDIVFGPSPDDVYVLDGIRARHADHVSGRAKIIVENERKREALYGAYCQQQNAMMQNGFISHQQSMMQQANQYGRNILGRGYGY